MYQSEPLRRFDFVRPDPRPFVAAPGLLLRGGGRQERVRPTMGGAGAQGAYLGGYEDEGPPQLILRFLWRRGSGTFDSTLGPATWARPQFPLGVPLPSVVCRAVGKEEPSRDVSNVSTAAKHPSAGGLRSRTSVPKGVSNARFQGSVPASADVSGTTLGLACRPPDRSGRLRVLTQALQCDRIAFISYSAFCPHPTGRARYGTGRSFFPFLKPVQFPSYAPSAGARGPVHPAFRPTASPHKPMFPLAAEAISGPWRPPEPEALGGSVRLPVPNCSPRDRDPLDEQASYGHQAHTAVSGWTRITRGPFAGGPSATHPEKVAERAGPLTAASHRG